MKWWTDLMHVAGINFHIPHSFNPRAPYDNDCPPYFYNGGFEPRWPLYRVYADYTSRLTLMLQGGRHVCPVALLFLGSSARRPAVLPDRISTALQDGSTTTMAALRGLRERRRLVGKEIQLREESYRILIMPPVKVIPYATLAKVKEFFEGRRRGQQSFLPTKS
jgi:hypothetical protein